ncbi:hypothetical protein ISP17_17065 [Dyella ginsengisoli]|uniref:Uncharacterized protein n=1 Tax=Dyella ginsengisoli TaxID=363848 RepID=A0ABW8JWY3_9GAMM
MKILIVAVLLLCCMSVFAKGPRSYRVKAYHAPRSSIVHVRGHVTKAGVYVAPSFRTEPNHTKVDNWSSKPNVNPYSGKVGTKDPYTTSPHGH